MLVCNKCGTLVEHFDLPYVTEMHGERHRKTACKCGGNFIEATKCKACGGWFDNTELHGVCEECLAECETVGSALEIGDSNRTMVAINGFIADILDEDMINAILTKWVEENYTDHSRPVVDYCEYDKSYFSDFVAEKAVD
jgi:hypothetical protein